MSDDSITRYRAFISYSHRDERWCDWLHKALEKFRIDSALIGRETAVGRVPPDLRPIFRDRDEFSSGSLSEQTLAALKGSQFLIVIASPNAAQSHYVNEEIRQFRALLREGRVLAMIVEGEPPECFAPALPEDVIAADALKDGKDRALIKIVAGLTALPFDDLWMREVKAAKKRAFAKAAAVVTFGVLAIAAGFFGQQYFGTKEVVEKHETKVVKQGREIEDLKRDVADAKRVLASLRAGLPNAAPGQRQEDDRAVDSIAQGAASGEPRLRRALDLLAEGKVAEATPLLQSYASDENAQIEKDTARLDQKKKDAATAFRNLGAISSLYEPKKARDYYAKAVELDPENAEGLVWDGWFQFDAKNLGAAEKSYRAIIALGDKGADEHQIFRARTGLGDIALERGDWNAALTAHSEARSAMEHLVRLGADNAEWQRDLSVSYVKIGDVFFVQDNRPEALKSYREGLLIAERVARSGGNTTDGQRLVSIFNLKIGDALLAQNKLDDALKSYLASLAIAEHLAESDARNTQWQNDLAGLYERIGDVLFAQENFPEALKSYRAGLVIIERLAHSDAGNASLQDDHALILSDIGDVLVKQGNLVDALKSYRAAHAIFESLAPSHADIAGWRRNLSVSYNKIGDVLVSQGNLADALKSYRSGLAIAKRLSQSDAGNAERRRDLVVTYAKLGNVYSEMKEIPQARDALTKGWEIIAGLVEKYPDWAEWKPDIAWFKEKLAALDAAPAGAGKAGGKSDRRRGKR